MSGLKRSAGANIGIDTSQLRSPSTQLWLGTQYDGRRICRHCSTDLVMKTRKEELTAVLGAHGHVSSGFDEGMAGSQNQGLRRTWLNAPLPQTRLQIINPSAGGLYTGLSHAVSTIYRLEGLRTLWRGVSSVIVGAGAIHSWKIAEIGHTSDILVQVLLMLFILALTKSLKKRPVETKLMANTILSQLVRRLWFWGFNGVGWLLIECSCKWRMRNNCE